MNRLRTSFFTFLASAGFFMMLPATALSQSAGVSPDSSVLTYENDIHWTLARTCFECHSGDESKGELLLDTFEDLMEGGEHGSPVVPGSTEKSILYQKLQPNPPFGKQMPRKRGLALSQLELDMIRVWIEQGALKSRSSDSEKK